MQASKEMILDGSKIASDSTSSSYYLHEFDFLDDPVNVNVVDSFPEVAGSDSSLGSDWSDIGDD